MSTETDELQKLADEEYKYGFVTDIESEALPPGLSEGVIRLISSKKQEPEWMLEWRLKAYRQWLKMVEPDWAFVTYPKIDYQDIVYYSAPKSKGDGPKSLEEVDPELLETYKKLGIPLEEQEILSGVAVDAVFDSVSVATTFREKLGEEGIIFCSMSEALQEHPDLVRKYLGSVVPYSDNFFAALNSAVFSDGSFCYIPKGVRCPMELSTYFRINAAKTGQFERTLIVADEGSYVSYLEGCTAPMRDENQLHAAVVELVAHKDATIKYSTIQNWYPGDDNGVGGIYNFVTKRGKCLGANSRISWTQVETGSAIRQWSWRHLQFCDETRQMPGSKLANFLDAGRNRFSHYLEVPELCPHRGQFHRRILLGGSNQEATAGRHRDKDDPYRQEHQQQHCLEGNICRTRSEHLPWACQDQQERQECAKLHAV
jgi:Fe-S cluster assembly protein SufB